MHFLKNANLFQVIQRMWPNGGSRATCGSFELVVQLVEKALANVPPPSF